MKSISSRINWCSIGLATGGRRARVLIAIVAFVFLLGCVSPCRAVDPPPSGRTFDSLTVRGTTYTRVTVVDISKRHLSFRSAQGFATVLLEDLEPGPLAQLGRGPLNLGATEREGTAGSAESKPSKPVRVQARETPDKDADADEDAEEDDEKSSTPIVWTIRTMAGAGLLGLGFFVISAGHLWLVGTAFRTSVGWGIALIIGTFVAGIITVMFCRTHWDVARRPVFLKLAGVVLLVGGFLLFHG